MRSILVFFTCYSLLLVGCTTTQEKADMESREKGNSVNREKANKRAFDQIAKEYRGGSNVESACKTAYKDYDEYSYEPYRMGSRIVKTEKSKLLNDCTIQVEEKIKKILDDILTKKSQPLNCKLWALTREDSSWLNTRYTMSFNPTIKKNSNVQFSGKITEVDQNMIVIMNGEGDSVILQYNNNSQINGTDHIQIGRGIVGFGKLQGSQKVSLVSGQKITVPLIYGACIDGYSTYSDWLAF